MLFHLTESIRVAYTQQVMQTFVGPRYDHLATRSASLSDPEERALFWTLALQVTLAFDVDAVHKALAAPRALDRGTVDGLEFRTRAFQAQTALDRMFSLRSGRDLPLLRASVAFLAALADSAEPAVVETVDAGMRPGLRTLSFERQCYEMQRQMLSEFVLAGM